MVYVVSDRYAGRRGQLVMRVERPGAVTALALRRAIRDALPPGSGAGWIIGFTEYFERELRSRRFIVGSFVMHDGSVMLLAGTGIGAFVAMWSAQLLEAWLYDVYFVDVVSLVVAELVLLGAGLAACTVPALGAARANPVEILRAT